MSDVASGWFALAGAALGAIGTQISATVTAVSKSKARKAKAIAADKAAKAEIRRPLYTRLIEELHNAAWYANLILRAFDNPGAWPPGGRPSLHKQLAEVRNLCRSVQIDGSDAAKEVVTRVLAGIEELWEEVDGDRAFLAHAMTKGVDALTSGEAELIEAGRDDFGGSS